jgi:nucleotide-binding universal stress UspA family protein
VSDHGDRHTRLREVGSPFHGDEDDRMRPVGAEDDVVAGPGDVATCGGPGRHRVVVGVDGSAESEAALRWAVHYGERTGSAIHAVAVRPGPGQPSADERAAGARPGTVPGAVEPREWLHHALAVVRERARASSGFRARVHGHTEEGDPAEVLLAYAQGAELLVVGRHGYDHRTDPHRAGTVLGSVADRCLRKATCPVVLLPSPPPRPN